MKTRWFIRLLSASILLLVVSALALASQGVAVNAQATAVATSAAPPPPSKMRWDIINFLTNAAGDTFTVAPGGVFSASANDGSTITYTGTGTFGPRPSDPVTGGGTWATTDPSDNPVANGNYTVTGFVSFAWDPTTLPAGIPLVDKVGDIKDASGGLATLTVAYTNKDGSAAGTGLLILSCRETNTNSIAEAVIGSMGTTLFYNPGLHIGQPLPDGSSVFRATWFQFLH